jgi:hypothetical protein
MLLGPAKSTASQIDGACRPAHRYPIDNSIFIFQALKQLTELKTYPRD